LSYYLQEVPGTTGFVSFFSRRGPDNTLTLSAGQPDFKDMFGTPNINDYGKAWGQGPYMAWNHLGMSGSLYCIRALPDDATFANLRIDFNSDGTGSIVVSSKSNIYALKTTAEKDLQVEHNPLHNPNIWPIVLFYPLGRGDSYNDFGITLVPHTNPALADQGIYTLNIFETSASTPIDNLIESFEVSFDEQAVDESGDSIFITEVVNRFSKFIDCYVNELSINEWKKTNLPIIVELPSETQEYPPGSGIIIESSAVHFTGGSEGSLVTIDSTTGRRTVDPVVANQLLVSAYMGLLDEDTIDLDWIYFNIVYDAGYTPDIKESIRYLSQDVRRDCFAFLDNGDNATVQDSINARNNDNDMNTFYCGIFEPFNKVYDVHTGKNLWLSPIYHMSHIVPMNDALYQVWWPNAGYNRATLSTIKEMRFNPKLSQRDQLYLAQINPIVRFSVGYTVWGNLTTQKRPSKLSNISTVRTVLYIKRALEQFCKWYIFEFNDSETHSAIASEIAGFLQTLQDARALEGYSVEVGATEYEKKQKICHVNVTLVPVGIIERIYLNLFVQ
jgi:hypothetical protein